MSRAGYIIERTKWGLIASLILVLAMFPAALVAFIPTQLFEEVMGFRAAYSSVWEMFSGLVTYWFIIGGHDFGRIMTGGWTTVEANRPEAKTARRNRIRSIGAK